MSLLSVPGLADCQRLCDWQERADASQSLNAKQYQAAGAGCGSPGGIDSIPAQQF